MTVIQSISKPNPVTAGSASGATRPIAGPWEQLFVEHISSANESLILCAPFISQVGGARVASAREDRPAIARNALILTDLSPKAVCAGATDPVAVAASRHLFAREGSGCEAVVVHLPKLHAKVYVVDGIKAVVTSGNLTAGGLYANYEYGVLLTEPEAVRHIERNLLEYAALGAEVNRHTLLKYCELSRTIWNALEAQRDSTSVDAEKRLAAALRKADDALIRVRLAGGAMHTIFARTIEFVLRRDGSMTTEEMHPRIQQLHPDLCDDSIDREIVAKGSVRSGSTP